MQMDNVEYWVLKSMAEAQISLENGEVPVGCLFLIHDETLRELTQEYSVSKKQIEINKDLSHITGNPSIVDTKQQKIESKNITCCDEMIVDSVSFESSANQEMTTTEVNQDMCGIDNNLKSYAKNCTQKLDYSIIKDKSGGYIIIARGKNEVNATKNATRHAEMVCIDQIVEKYPHNFGKVFENITVIVNVEPCIMCMAALLDLNVKLIVFTCVNDRFGYNILGITDKTNYFEIAENIDSDNKPDIERNNIENSNTSLEERSSEFDRLQESKDETPTQSIIVDENLNATVQYKLSFMNKHLLAKQDDILLSKISSLVEVCRMNLCHVFHYRKYESDTMDILKLFYKGVNPNAPKHKVKIRS